MPWTAEHQVLERKIDSLNLRINLLDSTSQAQNLETRAELGNQIGVTNEHIEILGAKLDDYGARLSRLAQRSAVGAGAQGASSLKPTPESTSTPTPGANSVALYNQAYSDYTRGKYELALQGFQSYLKAFPASDLSDNAQYWLGESSYDQGQYPLAVAEFQKVIDKYAESDKAVAALYKIGICLEKLGERDPAIAKYQAVIQKYPFSPEAKLAEESLRRLKK